MDQNCLLIFFTNSSKNCKLDICVCEIYLTNCQIIFTNTSKLSLLEVVCKKKLWWNVWSSKLSHAPISHMSASMCWTVLWAQAPEETVEFHAVLFLLCSIWKASSIHSKCEDPASSQRACIMFYTVEWLARINKNCT